MLRCRRDPALAAAITGVSAPLTRNRLDIRVLPHSYAKLRYIKFIFNDSRCDVDVVSAVA